MLTKLQNLELLNLQGSQALEGSGLTTLKHLPNLRVMNSQDSVHQATPSKVFNPSDASIVAWS